MATYIFIVLTKIDWAIKFFFFLTIYGIQLDIFMSV